jgi:hypothetical protein
MRVRLLLLLSRRGGGGGGCEIIDFGSSDFATLHFTLRPQRTHKNILTLGLGRNQITAYASSKIFYTQRDDFHQRKK